MADFDLPSGGGFWVPPNTKDAPYHMQTPIEQIGAALNMFYDGMSLSAIANHLKETYNNPVNPSTVYRWLIRYTFIAITTLEPLKPKVSDTWIVDETVIKVGGHNLWFWDIIDEETRFLLASHLSRARTTLDAATIMRRAWKRADKAPRFIISDQLAAYIDGIELVFGAEAKHIQSRGMTEEINTYCCASRFGPLDKVPQSVIKQANCQRQTAREC